MKATPSIFLLLALALASCQTERTVYDEYGNVVKESEPGVEKDIYSVMESRFDSAFSEKKNKDGVPESASSRVSRYQKDIDGARSGGKQFLTKSFDGLSESNLQSKTFADSGKAFTQSKTFDGGKTSSFSRDMRPDFLNEHKGLAHKDYTGLPGRSAWEGQTSSSSGQSYLTHASRYKAHEPSTYIQSRENLRPQPDIIDHRDQGKKNIEETRRLMGRDESSLY